MAHAAKGRSAEADEAMAKAQEAWGKAAAQQALADQAVSGARAATARAQTALDGAQAALAGLATQGLSRNALMSPTTLVDQAARLTAGAGKAATAAEASANAVRTTLSGATDPGEVAGVVKLIAGAQAEIVGAQGESSAAAAAQRTSTGASKNANSKLAFVTNALDSGGTEAADPVVAQVSAFRDTAATGGAESRQHANEAQRLSASSATKAAAALAAATELAARFAALGKSSPYLTSINKAAQQAVDAATKAQRSAAIAEKSATSAEDAARQADASLADAHGRVQKYLDDLEARNAPVYDSGGY
ncbi:MAG: hypothetical protein ACAI38_10775 [Myxococcota bacterium]